MKVNVFVFRWQLADHKGPHYDPHVMFTVGTGVLHLSVWLLGNETTLNGISVFIPARLLFYPLIRVELFIRFSCLFPPSSSSLLTSVWWICITTRSNVIRTDGKNAVVTASQWAIGDRWVKQEDVGHRHIRLHRILSSPLCVNMSRGSREGRWFTWPLQPGLAYHTGLAALPNNHTCKCATFSR